MVKVFLLALMVSIFLAGGVDLRVVKSGPGVSNNEQGQAMGYSEGYYQKIENPWQDLLRLYPTGSHDAKLNLRLTVPVVLHYLGVRSRWSLPVLTISAICAILLLSCAIAFRVTGDRVTSLFVTLGVASTYIGSFAVIAYMDAIALVQLALALLPGINPWLKGLLVFTASFTDERAFVASAFLLLPDLCLENPDRRNKRTLLLLPGVLAVVGGMAVWSFARLLLGKYAGLYTSQNGFSLKLFVPQIPLMHASIWYALEGGWLLAALAALLLWQRRQWGALLFMFGMTMAMLGGALMVADVTRSTSYMLPLLFVSLMMLAEKQPPGALRGWCLVAFVISLVGGNYNVFCGHIYWCQPLLVQMFEIICDLAFYSLYK